MSCCPFVIQNERKNGKNSKWILIPLRFIDWSNTVSNFMDRIQFQTSNSKKGNNPKQFQWRFCTFCWLSTEIHVNSFRHGKCIEIHFQIWYMNSRVLLTVLKFAYVPCISCIQTMKWYTGWFAFRKKLKNSHSRIHSSFIGVSFANMRNSQFQECCIRCAKYVHE